MAMTSQGRADAIFAKMAESANWDKASPDEKAAALAGLKLIWGDGDLAYITGHAVVPLGITVQVNPGTGAGATTGPGSLT